MAGTVDLYGTYYGNYATDVYGQVRRETYGEDIGQSSWITVAEYRLFFDWLDLKPGMKVLDLGSGSGGPALFLARDRACQVTGLDVNDKGIATANENVRAQGMAEQVRFLAADVTQRLPLPDGGFQALVCIDALCHMARRGEMFKDWYRLLAPGGRCLVTDPVVISGLVSKDELATRASTGHFEFAPPGVNERLLQAAGFRLLRCEDRSDSTAQISKRWHDARANHAAALRQIEGEATFDGLQRFLAMVHDLTRERRLSRMVYVGER